MPFILTEIEAREMYQDFRLGFTTGASGRSELDLVGTPPPLYRDFFDKGLEEGREVFRVDMLGCYERLVFMKEEGQRKLAGEKGPPVVNQQPKR
jgi:hypothetical protein